MTEYVIRAGVDIGLLIVGTMGLIGLLKILGNVVKLIPFPESLRPTVERSIPVLGLAIVIAYIAFGGLWISLREPLFAGVVVALLVVLILFAWSPLYDLVSGVAFRAGRVCQVGDHVTVGDVSGTVVRVGSRVLVVRTASGDEAVLPYGKINRTPLRRTQSVEGAYVHTFPIDPVELEELRPLRERVAAAALRCPWASVRHPPKIERHENGALEISVYALSEDYATEVERAVRAAIPKQRRRSTGEVPAAQSPAWLTPPKTPGLGKQPAE